LVLIAEAFQSGMIMIADEAVKGGIPIVKERIAGLITSGGARRKMDAPD